jgi:DNA polymerase III subunit beta
MKARFNRHELTEALAAVGQVAASRTPKPVLQCVLIDAQADCCVLTATDLEVGIRYVVSVVEVEKQGRVVVPADKLGQIVRESADEVVLLETEETVCHLRGEDAHYQMYVQDPADFPPVAELEGAPDFEIPAGELRRMAEWTSFAAARENTRYAINGVLWERVGKTLTLVATDGRRLSLARGPLAEDGPKVESIVPIKAMSLVQRIFADDNTAVGVKLVGNQVLLRSPRATVSTALVEGQFPKYRDVIPQDCNQTARIKTADFHSAVKRAALLTNEESKGVRLAFRKDRLTLSGRAPTQGEAEITVPIEYGGVDLDIGFNPVFLIDALRVVPTESVTFQLKETNRPGLLRSDDDHLYVVMPISLT